MGGSFGCQQPKMTKVTFSASDQIPEGSSTGTVSLAYKVRARDRLCRVDTFGFQGRQIASRGLWESPATETGIAV